MTPPASTAVALVSSFDFWVLTISRLVIFLLGGAFAVLSLLAYRREEKRSLLGAIVGFSLISVGLIVEWTYEVGVKGDTDLLLTGTEVARIQIVEAVLVFAGLAVLLFSVSRS